MVTQRSAVGRWITPARFDHDYGAAGVDRLLREEGAQQRGSRVSLRSSPDSDRGVLYLYDPLWDEYYVVAEGVTVREARMALEHTAQAPSVLVRDVDALAVELQQRSAGRGYEVGPELGVVL